MSISLNPQAVIYAKRLIRDGNIKNDEGHWSEHNPNTEEENAFLEEHEIEEYGNWHLGIDTSKGENTKGRFKYPYGDFKSVHRDGLIAVKERAAQQGCTDIENAADQLLKALEENA
ncbi:hypothetical protein [Hymenobacter arizonensis]|uniref:Uncharacterized protein n=1 Tax=Hymenobacter arizonensis TaxID=1227077 RepID=A0A1I5ZC35_HYMAR|nr:hypothetical protein [Hymenobacter arizonensis]SFQ54066.1 hypothetical protein SAMN04515668_2928 [Hymenobacter arizonensis]